MHLNERTLVSRFSKPFVSCGLACLAALALQFPTHAGVDWRFPVGLSYASGFHDLVDTMEDNFGLARR